VAAPEQATSLRKPRRRCRGGRHPAWMKGFLDTDYNFGTLVSDQAWQAS
jgi:hypothetical protein